MDDFKELADYLERNEEDSKTVRTERRDRFSSRKHLHLMLLRQTLQHALTQVPYYKQLSKSLGVDWSFQKISDLRKLPLLDSDLVKREPYRFFAANAVNDIVTVRRSSGTTSTPMRAYMTQKEIEVQKHFSRIMRSCVGTYRKKISLYIGGVFLRETISDFVVVASTYFIKGRVFARAIDDLLYENHIPGMPPRVSVVHVSSSRWLRLLTEEMLAKGVDPASTDVRDVWVMDSVSTATKKWIKETWKAQTHCSYSLTECAGGAYECEEGNYHFDLPSFPEIVNSDSLEPTRIGCEGKLLLTTLHPFQQLTPLIRYSTNDIVIRGPNDCGCGEHGLSVARILGRQENCINLGYLAKSRSDRRWFGYYDARDALEEFPEYFVIKGYGAPIFKVSQQSLSGSTRILIRVCLNRAYSNKKKIISRKIEERFQRLFQPWQKQLESGKIRKNFQLVPVPPGIDPLIFGFSEQH